MTRQDGYGSMGGGQAMTAEACRTHPGADDHPAFCGAVIIGMTAPGKQDSPYYGAMYGWKCAIFDAETGKPVNTVQEDRHPGGHRRCGALGHVLADDGRRR